MRSFTYVILAGAAWCLSPSAFAHRDFFNTVLETGSGALAQISLSGQWGITPTSPFYLSGEASYESFYLAPDDNCYRGLFEAGYESVHFGLAGRVGYGLGPYQGMTMDQFGVTIFYRFVRWGLMSSDEEMYLKRDERKAIVEKHRQEVNSDIPKAPLLAISFDQFSVSSAVGQLQSVNPTRVQGFVRATFEPFWTFMPNVAIYNYNIPPFQDPAGYSSYASRALRLVKLGPYGQYSGIFGMPNDVEQIYSEIKVFPQLQIDAAITRVSLNTPSFVGYSFWIGFDRFLSENRHWAISPSYEQYFMEGQAFSYFTVAFRYGAASSWLPPQVAPSYVK